MLPDDAVNAYGTPEAHGPRPSPAPGQDTAVLDALRWVRGEWLDRGWTDAAHSLDPAIDAASRPLPAAGLEVDHALKRLEKLIDGPYAGGLQDFMQRVAVRVRELRMAVDRVPAAGLSEQQAQVLLKIAAHSTYDSRSEVGMAAISALRRIAGR